MMNILSGKQIRLKRIEHDMKLTEFARKMGVSKTWMSLVETGRESGEPIRAKATLYFLSLGDALPGFPRNLR
jgi:transcriptional regulator with XRE-family HTH domain